MLRPPKKKKTDTISIDELIEYIKKYHKDTGEHKAGWWNEWKETTRDNPPVIPTIFPKPKPFPKPSVWEETVDFEETRLIAFMQECRERTADMRDEEKCARCKLRFRCWTEIKVKEKRKTNIVKPKKKPLQKQKEIYFKNAMWTYDGKQNKLSGISFTDSTEPSVEEDLFTFGSKGAI
jgi:hypothetical protein